MKIRKKGNHMKLKIFNIVLTVLAVVGFFIIMGAVGTMDFMVEQKVDYPMVNTIKTVVIGMIMMLPAIIREVF